MPSTSVLVNQDGTVAGRNYYYPYGGNRGGKLSGLTTKRFTGQYHEEDLSGGEGLYYFNARLYDAQLGCFVSPDSGVNMDQSSVTENAAVVPLWRTLVWGVLFGALVTLVASACAVPDILLIRIIAGSDDLLDLSGPTG